MIFCRQIDRHHCVRRVNLTCEPNIVPGQVSVTTNADFLRVFGSLMLCGCFGMTAGRRQREVDRADTPGLELQRAEAVS